MFILNDFGRYGVVEMTKERRSVSLDSDLDRMLEDPDVNASDLINRLLRHYQGGGRVADVALGMKLEETRRTITDTEAEVARLESRLDELRSEEARLARKIEDKEDRRDRAVDEFLNLDGEPAMDPDNPAVKNYAAKAGVPPERFIDAVEAHQ